MSQSPSGYRLDTEYLSGWAQIARLVRDEGRSFSGRERHCCFLNTGGGRFANVAAVSGLDSLDDGRAVAITDWDNDGDLDLWVSNRTAPRIRYYENKSESNGSFVTFKLEGTRCNRDAIGTRIEVRISEDSSPLIKTVRAGEGFLAQSSKKLHFGIGDAQEIDSVVIRWPDGGTDKFDHVQGSTNYFLKQGDSELQPVAKRSKAESDSKAEPSSVEPSSAMRIVLPHRPPLVDFKLEKTDGSEVRLFDEAPDKPFLLNVWQTTCLPCLKELAEFQESKEEVAKSGLEILTLHVNQPEVDSNAGWQAIGEIFDIEQFAYPMLMATNSLAEKLNNYQKKILQRHHQFSLPTSLLVDENLRVIAVYKGPVSTEQLLKDVALTQKSERELFDELVPFKGYWIKHPLDKKK